MTEINVSWPVTYVPQQATMSCWAASIAMLVNYRDGTTLTDSDICTEAGITSEQGAVDSDYAKLMEHWRLHHVAGQCMTPEGWAQLIGGGPTLVGWTGHIVVASAVYDDGSSEGSSGAHIYVLNPDPGVGEGWLTWDDMEERFELRANREMHMMQAN
jgi:ABC-type bacteriocin/lantibiotic exporter with double-glycine peptidase domain